MSDVLRVHATTLSLNGTAVMIRGGSGTGKSDLALQILEQIGTGLSGQSIITALIADDQTLLRREGDKVFASAPAPIAGLLEVRGHDVLKLENSQNLPLALVVDLRPVSQIERLPQPEDLLTDILGFAVPRIFIDPSKPSAASRLRVAWSKLTKHQNHP